MIETPAGDVLEATDLSPIPNLDDEDRRWLGELAVAADAATLALRISGPVRDDIEPIVSYDAMTGLWWAGRFIGEVQFQNRTLRIMPRYGLSQLQRWLFRISGVRLIGSKGKYDKSRIWLWELLAKLWESQLLAAAKHGVPTVRVDELHYGETIRGRLDVRLTAKSLSRGRREIVSRPRIRRMDASIGGIIVHALGHFRRALGHLGNERSWLTERGYDIIKELCAHISPKEAAVAASSKRPLRYTPITEGYRPVVELSRAIARKQPSTSTTKGRDDVIGVLIDMAELWELYIFHVLRSGMPDFELVHTGRNVARDHWLLKSGRTGDRLGAILPDILVLSRKSGRVVAVLDAKYKTTVHARDRPNGIVREDLYQITAYISAFAGDKGLLVGGLIYPKTGELSGIETLGDKSPWQLSGAPGRVWFFSLRCEPLAQMQEALDAEATLSKTVNQALDEAVAARFS